MLLFQVPLVLLATRVLSAMLLRASTLVTLTEKAELMALVPAAWSLFSLLITPASHWPLIRCVRAGV